MELPSYKWPSVRDVLQIVVSTLGTIYNLGDETDESSERLRQRLRDEVDPDTGERVFNVPVALPIMVFFALCCQCAATLATIKRETNSRGRAWLAFAYMPALAWVASLIVYQVGSLFV